jgi:hypothetical protein
MKQAKVTFNAVGYVTQIVTLSVPITLKELQAGLNSGKYVTTLHGDDSVIEETATGKQIAEIEDTDNNLEYTEFEVEKP